MKTDAPGTITATGSANGVSFTPAPGPPHTAAIIAISGTHVGCVFAVEGLLFAWGSTVYFKRQFQEVLSGNLYAGSISAPDNASIVLHVDIRGCQAIRVYCVSGTPTNVAVNIISGTNAELSGENDLLVRPPLVNPSPASGAFAGPVLSNTPTDGIGYATGAGGAVTQGTSRTTGVTLNKVCGAITLVSAAGSATPFTFTVTNSAVAATDTIVINQKSGTDLYSAVVTNVAAGSFKITITDLTGTTTEQPVFNFAIVKGVAS